jgi:hypothetical protein
MGRTYGKPVGTPKRPRHAGVWFRYWWEQNVPDLTVPLLRLQHVRSGRYLVASRERAQASFRLVCYGRGVPKIYMDGSHGDVRGPLAEDYQAFMDLMSESREARRLEYAEKHGLKYSTPYVPKDGDFQILAGPPDLDTPARLQVGLGLAYLRGKQIYAGMNAHKLSRMQDYLAKKESEKPEEDRAALRGLRENRLKRALKAFEDAQSEYNRVYAEVRSRPETYTLGDLYRDYPAAKPRTAKLVVEPCVVH